MKKKILFIFAMFMLIVLPRTVLAIPSLFVGDEDIYIEDGEELSNEAGTAKYSNGVLELNNYTGGPISLGTSEPIKIILKGKNVINADYVIEIDEDTEFIGISAVSDLEITGDGELTINNSDRGIYSEDGKIDINCKSIKIVNPSFAGIYIENGDGDNDIIINSDITVTTDYEKSTTIYGFYSYDNVTINGGKIDINVSKATAMGVSCGSFTMNSGKLLVNSTFIGIAADYSINLNGGYLEVTTPGEGLGVAMVSLSEEEEQAFNISDKMEVIPADISLQTVDIKELLEANARTLGKEGAYVDFEEGLKFVNIANKVTIKEKAPVEEPKVAEETNPNTYDNILIMIITFIISAALIVFAKKKING